MKTYEEFIAEIINKRGRYLLTEDYKEKHHIQPRCCGGSDEDSNLVDLFAEEHYEAHRLLAIENPDNYHLQYAWTMMTLTRNGLKIVSADDYAKARKEIARLNSELFKGRTYSEETHEKMRKAAIGNKRRLVTKTSEIGIQHMREAAKLKCPMTEETKKKIGDGNRGKTVSDESKKKISEARKGIKFSAEHKQKLSEAQKGISKPSSKYKHTAEQGKKAWETRRVNNTNVAANKGRLCITNGSKNRYILSKETLPEGWFYGSTQANHVKTYNKTWLNDGKYAYFVNNDDVSEYLQKGYSKGKNGLKTKKADLVTAPDMEEAQEVE